MKQQTVAMAAKYETGFEQHRRPTRRDEFLDTMNRIVPWADLCAVIDPHYPKRGNGRPPIGLERMLRIHFIQHWFIWPTLPAKKRSATSPACAILLVSTRHYWRSVPLSTGRQTTDTLNVERSHTKLPAIKAIFLGEVKWQLRTLDSFHMHYPLISTQRASTNCLPSLSMIPRSDNIASV